MAARCPAVSESKATSTPVLPRSATWLKVLTWSAVSAVPHGATPAQRPAQAVVTAMASNGPSTMTGRAPAAIT